MDPLAERFYQVLESASQELGDRAPGSAIRLARQFGIGGYVLRHASDAEGDRPEILVRWYDGGMMPPLPKEAGSRSLFASDGTLIVGDEGMMLKDKLLPEARAKEIGKPPRVLPRSPGHYAEWIAACKGGAPAGSNFVDHAGLLAAVVLMGNVAIRAQQKLYWDAEKLQFKNSDAANRLLNPPYAELIRLGQDLDFSRFHRLSPHEHRLWQPAAPTQRPPLPGLAPVPRLWIPFPWVQRPGVAAAHRSTARVPKLESRPWRGGLPTAADGPGA